MDVIGNLGIVFDKGSTIEEDPYKTTYVDFAWIQGIVEAVYGKNIDLRIDIDNDRILVVVRNDTILVVIIVDFDYTSNVNQVGI